LAHFVFDTWDKNQHFASLSAHSLFVLHPSCCVPKVQKANTDFCIFKHCMMGKAQNLIEAKHDKTPSLCYRTVLHYFALKTAVFWLFKAKELHLHHHRRHTDPNFFNQRNKKPVFVSHLWLYFSNLSKTKNSIFKYHFVQSPKIVFTFQSGWSLKATQNNTKQHRTPKDSSQSIT